MDFLKVISNFTGKFKREEEVEVVQTIPENYVTIFGGHILQMKSVREIVNEGVVTHLEFRLVPTLKGFIQEYKIKDEDYDPTTWTIIKRFPIAYCVLENNNPMQTRWRIDCTWNGIPMDVNEAIINDLRKRLMLEQQNNKSARIMIASLQRDKKRVAEEPDHNFERTMKQIKEYKKLDESLDKNQIQSPQVLGGDPFA